MTTHIIGAGMAGLLAAEMFRREQPVIEEAQPALPDNHGALLRFRSDAVARETRQTFAKVSVLKAVKSGGRLRPIATLRDANEYSLKVTGTIAPRSVLDLDPCTRYVAPRDFLAVLARDARVRYRSPLTREALGLLKGQKDVATISTIPMPVLMDLVGWPARPDFQWRPIWSAMTTVSEPVMDVYQTIYYPDPEVPWYRASITGRVVIIEFMEEPDVTTFNPRDVFADFGLPEGMNRSMITIKRQEYGKLTSLPTKDRHEFITAMTDEFNLYSVGRFAVWRQILLDDVVNDVRVVESMITQRSAYRRRLGTK